MCRGICDYVLRSTGEGLSAYGMWVLLCTAYAGMDPLNGHSSEMSWNHIIKGYSPKRVLNLLCFPGIHYLLNAL